ncbi:acyl-CoA dehydrogenase [Paenibacillus sp. DMB20]|uniref:acyl-CoA dehydrogenase n=1 Tax=Paenibacillus sp. DMB20 TaxID=1642570 RepID=UPI0006280F2E|nr:acyl-CoA dehydrogenase [Paenibacillus sp. DMB20]KKO54824.1 acyl-CoA dehydrogenase [Paenibacillus sp. DMB20]
MLFTNQQIDMLREQSLRMDQEGTPTPEVLRFIYDERLFHLFVPDGLEGRMSTLPDAVRIFEECSRIDGNLGWLVTIGAGGGFFVPFMPEDISREVYARREAVIAGSGTPSGIARRVPGGYRVSGSWKYCSGSSHATVFTANAVIDHPDAATDKGHPGEPAIRSFILQPHQVRIDHDWKAFGLKATASHRIAVEEAFVPEEMTFSIAEMRAYHGEVIYRYPFLPFAQASFAAVALGISRHFMEAADELIKQRGSHEPLVHRWNEQMKVLEQARSAFHETIEESWSELLDHGALTPIVEEKVSSVCISTAGLSLKCGQTLFPLLGLAAAMENTAVNRCWRDLQTACQHALLRAQ